MAAANFYGMFLIIVMMGYGLAEVPMSIWRASDPVRALESQEFRAGAVETRMIDAEDQVDEAVDEVVAFRARLSRMPDPDVELVARAEQVLALAPRRDGGGMTRSASSRRRDAAAGSDGDGALLTLFTLANLHRNLKRSLVAAERARWDWDDLLERTAVLEKLLQDRRRVGPGDVDLPPARAPSAVVAASRAGARVVDNDEEDDGGDELGAGAQGRGSVVLSVSRLAKWARSLCNARGYTVMYRIAAFVSSAASLILVWCAVVSPFSQNLSVYGTALSEAETPIAVWLCGFCPLMYMGMCVYTALFKFPYLDVLALHGNRQTDAYNLLYNAAYMCVPGGGLWASTD
jgi:hypothetical protein